MSIENPQNLESKLDDSQTTKTNKVICEDGFCYLPQNEASETMRPKNLNMFDPI